MKFEELIGHHLMIGIPGDRLIPAIVRQFRETHAAGLIVFRPNFKSARAFKKLLSDLESKLGRKLLVAVDHEGGRVIHLAEGVTVFPDNWALGNTGEKVFARKQGEIESRELRRLGLDLNLAPTLDVLTHTFSPNIGIRSYGKDPSLVSHFGSARIKAMQAGGISACAKHFPGLGASSLDPHLDLPTLGMSWTELRAVHLKPFLQAIRAGVDCVMSSHPVYPKLDPSKVPATFSKKIIGDFLRGELSFKGVILSDDLEMGALRGLCTAGESAVRAVEAGHDMVLFCHDLEAQRQAYQALIKAYSTGRLKAENLKASALRIQKLILKRKTRFSGGNPRQAKDGARLASCIAARGIRSGGPQAVSARGGVHIIFPRFSELARKFYIEPEMLKEKAFASNLFRKHKIKARKITILPLQPGAREIANIKRDLKSGDPVIFFCYDAHLSQGMKTLLQAAAKKKNGLAVFLRDPYDEEYLKGKLPFITAYGFRKVQIEAAVQHAARWIHTYDK